MTLFDSSGFSEIKEPGWNYNTLKPPLKFKDVIMDIYYQWRSYYQSRFTFYKRLKFLIMRIFQRIAYNLGWILATRKYIKTSMRENL